ncbi:MAG: hypothetical protein ACKOOL_05125 [Novosphingobium sp.]
MSIALALGCERIVCIAPSLTPDIVQLQHIAEARGAQFNVIAGARPLLGLVSSADEVISLADGLFSSTAETVDLLSESQGVLVQPIEQGLAAGFERIDLNHAAAGAIRIPGRLVEQIATLPADCDPVSALQRIALQSGVRQREIPMPGQDGLFWALVRSDAEAHTIEPMWIRQRTRDTVPLGPARGIALLAVRSFGPAMLHAGTGSRALVIAAVVLALLALGAGWFALPVLGLALIALGWILRETAALLARIEHDGPLRSRGIDSLTAYGWAIDVVIVLLMAWGAAFDPGHAMIDRLFPPFMLIAQLRILAAIHDGRWGAWLTDRSLLSAALAGAILGGIGSEVAHGGAVVAAIAILVQLGGKSRLTRL